MSYEDRQRIWEFVDGLNKRLTALENFTGFTEYAKPQPEAKPLEKCWRCRGEYEKSKMVLPHRVCIHCYGELVRPAIVAQPEPEKPVNVKVHEKLGHKVGHHIDGNWYSDTNFIPDYSGDVREAIGALEKFCGNNRSAFFRRVSGTYWASFSDISGWSRSKSFAESICQAILEAK